MGRKGGKKLSKLLKANPSFGWPFPGLYWENHISCLINDEKESDAYKVGLALLNHILFHSFFSSHPKEGRWKDLFLPFKLLSGGERHECDITVYPLDLGNTLEFIDALQGMELSVIFDQKNRTIRLVDLFRPIGSNENSDCLCFRSRFALRFEINNINGPGTEPFHPYGTYGIPLRINHLNIQLWGTPDQRTKLVTGPEAMRTRLRDAIDFFSPELFASMEMFMRLWEEDRACRGIEGDLVFPGPSKV